jgi:hypothetical protein
MLLNDANPIYANVYKKSCPSSAEYSLRNGKIKPVILSTGLLSLNYPTVADVSDTHR